MRIERAALGVAALLSCCTRTHYFSSPEPGDGAASADAATPADDAGDAGDAGWSPMPDDADVALCGRASCACSNGIDDDGDQLVDGFDPECTGAFDQFEDSFATGVHGEDQEPKCQDCFFDHNSGAGDDGCSRASSCSVDGSANGTGACRSCEVSSACAERCEPLVPNGCDCFGCCGVWRAGVVTNVLLRSSCSLARLDDPAACPRCLPAQDCKNECGPCELCPGRSKAELPATCADASGPGYSCDEAAICVDANDCDPGLHYCQLGCCMDVPI